MWTTTVGEADEALERRLSDELDAFNAAATEGFSPSRELTVRIERSGELIAGVAGWTWGEAAGIALTWVRDSERGSGAGAAAIKTFEDEARQRGAQRAFVTSFTFQAPSFYERLGYLETFRWDGIPAAGHDDVHLRKEL